MAIGAILYPSGSSNADCTVPTFASLVPAEGNVDALLAKLGATNPGGATPTAAAIDTALVNVFGVRAATTARALVLATDGAPNCNAALDPTTCTCATGTGRRGCRNDARQCLDDTRTVASIAAAAKVGVPTYVIGIVDEDEATFAGVLDAMAKAGGRPSSGTTSYYAARSQTDLESALTAIRDQVGKCTFLTTSVPDASGSITVTIDGTIIPYDPTGTSGWSWASEENGQIVLAGATCDEAIAGDVSLVAHVGCGEDAAP